MDKLKAMQVFREAAISESFSVAADKLNLATSGVSRYIVNLESWLGVSLFQRSTRKVRLTEDGRLYLQKVEFILQNIRELELLADDSQSAPSGVLKITAPVYFSRHYLDPFFELFSKKYPEITLSLLISDRFVNLIEEGLDLSIRIAHLGDINFVAKKIGETYLKLVASPEYLAKHSDITKAEDISNHNCLIDAVVGFRQLWQFTQGSKTVKIPASGNMIVNDGEIITDLAKRGLGVAYLPNIFVDDAIASGELQWLLPETVTQSFPISALYPHDRHQSKALRLFVDELEKFMGNSVTKDS